MHDVETWSTEFLIAYMHQWRPDDQPSWDITLHEIRTLPEVEAEDV